MRMNNKPSRPPMELLRNFVRLYPFQPATSFFRWFETDFILKHDMPKGFGLDLGCGDGRLTKLIADRLGIWKLVGLEPDSLEIAQAETCGLYERLHCAYGDSIPEEDGTFDFVFSNSVLEHIPEVKPVLSEARRVIKPGGHFIFTVPSIDLHDCMKGVPLSWRILFRQNREDYLEEFDRRIAQDYYWNDSTWEKNLNEAGFSNVEVFPFLERSIIQRWEWLANSTSGWLYKLHGGKMRPIEIQRKHGMRKSERKTPQILVDPIARFLSVNVRPDAGEPPLYGCRLIRAVAD